MGMTLSSISPPDHQKLSKGITAVTTSQTSNNTAIKDFGFYARVGCDHNNQTFVAQQYTTYPFRLSRTFRLDEGNSRRAYLYLMNSAPGIFGGDRLNLGLTLEPNAHLYLTDQAATKVHKMPVADATVACAQLSWQITVGSGASLEFVPEPLMLYADAQLYQSTTITLEPTSTLFLSEIIVPGRLARSEYYQFREYQSRLQVLSSDGTLLFSDAMRLAGQSNLFKDSLFFTKYPLIANIFIVLPNVDLDKLSHEVATNSQLKSSHLLTGSSPLPNYSGLLIKVMGDRVEHIQAYIGKALSCVRTLKNEPELPHIPK